MNYLHKKSGVLFEKKVVELLTNTMELERKDLGLKSVMRVPVNKVEPGMVFAEDYFTSYGMLIAAKGETLTKDMMGALVRFAENGEIPHKINIHPFLYGALLKSLTLVSPSSLTIFCRIE